MSEAPTTTVFAQEADSGTGARLIAVAQKATPGLCSYPKCREAGKFDCSLCKSKPEGRVHYCGKNHQSLDWKATHKKGCNSACKVIIQGDIDAGNDTAGETDIVSFRHVIATSLEKIVDFVALMRDEDADKRQKAVFQFHNEMVGRIQDELDCLRPWKCNGREHRLANYGTCPNLAENNDRSDLLWGKLLIVSGAFTFELPSYPESFFETYFGLKPLEKQELENVLAQAGLVTVTMTLMPGMAIPTCNECRDATLKRTIAIQTEYMQKQRVLREAENEANAKAETEVRELAKSLEHTAVDKDKDTDADVGDGGNVGK